MTRVQLAGDCFVSSANAPASENTGPLLIRNHVDCTTGAKLVSRRILELAGPGSLVASYANETADEVLFRPVW